jgi:hypothetical protein
LPELTRSIENLRKNFVLYRKGEREVMANENTTPEQRAKLASAGFVRVDGLKTEGFNGGYVIDPKVAELGRFSSNNGVTALVTLGGETWLAFSQSNSLDDWARAGADLRAELYQELCPRGTGVHVPCSNGEGLDWRDIMCRLANPDWIPLDN